jgi:hypothetical protein
MQEAVAAQELQQAVLAAQVLVVQEALAEREAMLQTQIQEAVVAAVLILDRLLVVLEAPVS